MGQSSSSNSTLNQRYDNSHNGDCINDVSGGPHAKTSNTSTLEQKVRQSQDQQIGGSNSISGTNVGMITGSSHAAVNTGGVQGNYKGGNIQATQTANNGQDASNAQTHTATAGKAGYAGANGDMAGTGRAETGSQEMKTDIDATVPGGR